VFCLGRTGCSSLQNRTIYFARQNINGKNRECSLQALIFSLPFVIKHEKELGRSLRGFTHLLHLVLRSLHLHLHEYEPKEGSQKERVRRGCPDRATIVKAKIVEACISIPLSQWSLYVKVSNHFFEGLNFWAFFSLRGNGRTRWLQI
jgi:hypothetical protein